MLDAALIVPGCVVVRARGGGTGQVRSKREVLSIDVDGWASYRVVAARYKATRNGWDRIDADGNPCCLVQTLQTWGTSVEPAEPEGADV